MRPINDLAVGVVWILSTERRPANKTLEHDCSHRPPVTTKVVALPTKYLRGDIVRSTDGRICHDTTRFAPCVDLTPVTDSQIDLIQRNRVSIPCLV